MLLDIADRLFGWIYDMAHEGSFDEVRRNK
jgi:hypothetical protein